MFARPLHSLATVYHSIIEKVYSIESKNVQLIRYFAIRQQATHRLRPVREEGDPAAHDPGPVFSLLSCRRT